MKRLLTLYSEVQSTDVRWLWYPFIAIGKITLLQGDPGDGKSTMMIWNLKGEKQRFVTESISRQNRGRQRQKITFVRRNRRRRFTTVT